MNPLKRRVKISPLQTETACVACQRLWHAIPLLGPAELLASLLSGLSRFFLPMTEWVHSRA